MKDQPNKTFFIVTQNNLLSHDLAEKRRAAFFPVKKNILDSFASGLITSAAQKNFIEQVEDAYLTTFPVFPGEPKDEVIFDIDIEKIDEIISFTDSLAKKFNKKCEIKKALEIFDIKAVTDQKFSSKWIKPKDQVILVDVHKLDIVDNKNGICFIDNEETLYYLKDNISSIKEGFMSSSLDTLDIYCLIKKPIESLDGMTEERLTIFTHSNEKKKLSVMTYPSTNVGIIVAEVI